MPRKDISNIRKGTTESGVGVNAPKKRLTLAGMLKSVTKDNLHSEMDWGMPRGSEVW